ITVRLGLVRASFCIMVGLNLSLASRAAATTYIWDPACSAPPAWYDTCVSGTCNGLPSGRMRVFNNWGLFSCGGGIPPFPSSGDDVVIPAGTSFAHLNFASASVANATVNGGIEVGGTLTLTGTLNVNGDLVLDGGHIVGAIPITI